MADVVELIIRGEDKASHVFNKIANNAERAFDNVIDIVDRLETDLKTLPTPEIHMEQAISELQVAEESVEELKEEVIDLATVVNRLDKMIEIMAVAHTEQAEREVEELDEEADEASKDRTLTIRARINQALQSLNQFSQRMDEIGARGREIGEGMVDFADNVTQGLTVPIALIGAVAFKASGDYEHMFSVLSAKVGGVKSTMQELAPIAEQVFREGLGKDVEEVAIVTGHAHEKLKELNTAQLSGVINNVLALSQILGIDAVGAIDEARKMMDEFGITSNQAMDLIASGYTTADLEGKNLSKTLAEVRGRAEEVTGIAKDDVWVRFISLWRQLQEALGPIGSELVELAEQYLPSVIEKIQEFGEWFDQLSGPMKLAVVGFTAFLAVLPLVVMFLGALVMTAGALAPVFAFIGSTAGLITLGIVAIVAGVIILYNTFEEFAVIVDAIWGGFIDSIKRSASQFMSYLDPIKESLQRLWEGLQPILEIVGYVVGAVLVLILAGINGVFRALGRLIDGIVNAISFVVNVISGIFDILTGDFEGAKKHFGNALQDLASLVKNVFSAIGEFFYGIWDSIKSVLEGLEVDVDSIISGIVDGFMSVFSDLADWWDGFWNDFTSLPGDALNSFTQWWDETWNQFKQSNSELWNELTEPIVQFFSGLWNAISPYVMPVITFISEAWNALVEALRIIFFETLPALFQVAWNAINENIIKPIMEEIINPIKEKWNEFTTWISNLWSEMTTMASNKWNELKNAAINKFNELKTSAVTKWNEIKNGISETISPIIDGVTNKWTELKNSALNKFNEIKTTATNVWNGIKSAIIDPIKSAYDKVLGWIQDIKNAFSNMKISIPKPKLPHISVKKATTTIGGVSVPYPDFDISWYAKGGLFNGPSVIGVAEAGPEAVIPLSGPRMKPFAQTIASQMSKKQDDSDEDQQSPVVFQIQNMNVNDERHAEVMGRRMAKDMSYFMRSGGMRYGL